MQPIDINETTTEAAVVAALAREGIHPIVKTDAAADQDTPLLLWPRSEQAHSLEPFLAHPVRKEAAVTITDVQSFIAYLARFALPHTAIFCTLTSEGGHFAAIIDYHEKQDGKANRGRHRCTLEMRHTPEWEMWRRFNDKPLSQLEMAHFLEDNRLDIVDPEAAQIIEIAKTFEATQGVQFKSALRLQNGDRQLAYDVTTGAKAGQKGDLQIPEKITMKLPVFMNGPAYMLEAWFRYTIDGGALKLRYQLIRPHKLIELALLEARNAIQSETKITVMSGSVRLQQ